MKRFAAVVALFAASCQSVAATETTRLFTHKAWAVDLLYGDSEPFCRAGTRARDGTFLNIVAYPNYHLVVHLYNVNWRIFGGAYRHVIADVDYERWSGDAEVAPSGQSLFVEMGGAEVAVNFLTDLTTGNAMALYNEDMHRIAMFSLAGSSAAVAKLMECWGRVLPREGADPFIGTSARGDPFL
jgi:hypothetical protein